MTQVNEATLRRWVIGIMACMLPAPDEREITRELQLDHQKNPHNDSYKPRRRSEREIVAGLRVARALDIYEIVLERLCQREAKT